MLKICPCRGCERRDPVCHAKCGDYAEWREEYDKMKAQMAAEFYDPQRVEKEKHFVKCLKLQRRTGFYGN